MNDLKWWRMLIFPCQPEAIVAIASCGWVALNSSILECLVDMVEMSPRSLVLEVKFVWMKSWVSDSVQFLGLCKCMASSLSIETSAAMARSRSRSDHSLLFSSWGGLRLRGCFSDAHRN